MKKKLICFISAIVMVIALAGCSGGGSSSASDPMTAKQFKNAMEKKGLTVTDQIDSANGDNSYQDIYVAVDEEKYTFEYYFMKDVNSAKSVYEYATSNLDTNYQEDSSAVIIANSTDESGQYEVTASDYYCVVWQNENTVLYLTSYSDYKDEAKDILKDLGYK